MITELNGSLSGPTRIFWLNQKILYESMARTSVAVALCMWISTVYSLTHVLRELNDHKMRPDYCRGLRTHGLHTHQITIGIKQNNLDVVEKILYEVSQMTAPKYGQHLSFEELGNLVANPTATNAVLSWLRDYKVNIVHISTYGEYIVAQGSIKVFEDIFQTEFFDFSVVDQISSIDPRNAQKPMAVQEKVSRATSYSIPVHLDSYIVGIMDIITLPPPVKPVAIMHEARSRHGNDHGEALMASSLATPITLKNYYNIYGDGYDKGNQTTYQTIGQAFTQQDIALFQTRYGLSKRPVDKTYGLEIPSGDSCYGTNGPDNCGEASLDLQYIKAVAGNVSTTYWYDVGNDYNFKNFIINVSSFAHPSMVFSISYGSYEIFVGKTAVTFFNTEAMKLGARGVTIVAASGDDGVTGINLLLYNCYFSPFLCFRDYIRLAFP